MDEFFVQLAKERPQLTHEDIRNAAQRLPFKQHMLDAIRLAVDDFGATCKIVSDSTVFGVQSFLERHDLVGRVSEVVANPTHFEDGGKVLRVRPNQGDHVAPHGCQDCATNLCKGVVLDRILQQHRYSRVLYVGGGVEDFCSSTRLAMDDVVFARVSGKNELLTLLNENPDQIQAHIRQWRTGEDILAYFRSFFYRQYPECQLLVVFDFDDSLVNEDSDVFVFGSLHPELCQTVYERHAKKPIWPSVFDDMLQVLSSEKPHVTPELIRDAVAQIPIQARMIDAIRMAVELFGAEVKVISDGNTFYIESMLQHRELSEHVKEVFANPVEHETLDDGRTRLRIRPYHADHLDPHGCTWCPTNMCKGSILDSIRNGKSYSRVIYIGDGTGDFCPASRLTENDVVLARSHLVNGNAYGLQRRINENPGVVHAPVVSWSTGYDIYRRFAQFCPSPYVIPRVTPRISGSVLVVFDYDWSLVNENSDTFIFQQLYPQLLDTLRERRKTQPSWTKIMDDMLGVLAEDKANITSDTIRATVARVPIQTHMLDALRLAAEIHSADVKIVSDANSVYIESMLEHHGLTQDVSEVITNPASFELEENGCSRLRVRPYHGEAYEPHGCKWCPTNMCKGRIVDILRNAHSYTSVLYVGDGSGDFCAATHLTKNDVVFARADEANGRAYGLQKRIDSNAEMVKAAVVPWSTGDDIYRHFAQFFHAPPQ
ncbi:pyridoxal phosphate phosphatase, putative [Phytophthora infestans T30-4]|uniref:Pyridoxal phosphate phosphatase, putative n=1 Tax=Phytophthora infestans (strain T30-4) TaxID=403677 RepID=D0NPG4_PHYIT|nr:pyridoxal phosphate phosphatase, putative [Phytophthora infestans T30-4]EEY62506.1 pyridoxal phosphate phosphatase, putative [Phytophthora infestans T30-4]|eukprot:XP_002899142.1 pyridoxal phosphate phosphatase, putative [Phytophthora infestans T30-4]